MSVVEDVVRVVSELSGNVIHDVSRVIIPVKLELQPLWNVEHQGHDEAGQDVDHQVKSGGLAENISLSRQRYDRFLILSQQAVLHYKMV